MGWISEQKPFQVSNLLWFSTAFLAKRKKPWIFLLCALYTRFSRWSSSQFVHKKVKTKEGLVEEKLGRSGHDRASGRLERFCRGENLKEKLPRSRGGTGEGLWKKSMKTPSFQDSLCSSVPSPGPYFTGETIFHILLAKDTAKESKRLCRTEHHSPSLGLGGIFNTKCN